MELLLVELVLVVVMELDVLEEVWATTLFGPFSKMIEALFKCIWAFPKLQDDALVSVSVMQATEEDVDVEDVVEVEISEIETSHAGICSTVPSRAGPHIHQPL